MLRWTWSAIRAVRGLAPFTTSGSVLSSVDISRLLLRRTTLRDQKSRRVGKGALLDCSRGQNRALVVPTRRRYRERFCPPYSSGPLCEAIFGVSFLMGLPKIDSSRDRRR